MKPTSLLVARSVALIAALWLSPGIVHSQRPRGTGGPVAELGPVRELVLAVPFRLESPYVHAWRKEATSVSEGILLVLSVDPDLARARETAEPVLCVGSQTAERVNHGGESGRVVAIVPGASDTLARGSLAPVWFAPAELPERVDAAWIAREWTVVDRRLARSFTAADVASARASGGAPIVLARREELDALAADLVLAHAPEDVDLAARLKAPLAR